MKKLLKKYDLPDPETLIENPPTKFHWKNEYNKRVNGYWRQRKLSQSELYSSLKYLSKLYTVGKCHRAIKPYHLSVRDINRIPVKNKILTGRYIFQTNRVKFYRNEVNPVCLSFVIPMTILYSSSP